MPTYSCNHVNNEIPYHYDRRRDASRHFSLHCLSYMASAAEAAERRIRARSDHETNRSRNKQYDLMWKWGLNPRSFANGEITELDGIIHRKIIEMDRLVADA